MMKKCLCALLVLIMMASCTLSMAEEQVRLTVENVTVAGICEALTVEKMLEPCNAFHCVIMDSEGVNMESLTVCREGDRILLEQDYQPLPDVNAMVLIDTADPVGYFYSNVTCGTLEALSAEQILGMRTFEYSSAVIVPDSVKEENGALVVALDVGAELATMIHVDTATGLVTEIMDGNFHAVIEYDPAVRPDETIRDRVLAYQEGAKHLSFSAVDLDGETVDETMFSDARLIMVNFWEPWCGPCVKEMPYLEELYEQLKDQGFVILGVCSAMSDRNEIRDIVEDIGVTYPVLLADVNLSRYTTDYVPTTVFFDGNGNLLTEEPYIGAHSYSDWEKIILGYMN